MADLIERLTAPDGCPWDRKQTPKTLTVYLIEEMYELVDAVHRDDAEDIEEETGDVLFQLMFLLHIYRKSHGMTLDGIVRRNVDKMIRRHPHVFGEETIETSEEVRRRWQQIKQGEKSGKEAFSGLFDSIPKGVPALVRAYRVSDRAAKAGFDWETLPDVMKKVEEEWIEFLAEVRSIGDRDTTEADRKRLSMEFGDILFTLVNVARFAGIHPETALAESTRKFEERFRWMEAEVRRINGELNALTMDEWQQLWSRAKQEQ